MQLPHFNRGAMPCMHDRQPAKWPSHSPGVTAEVAVFSHSTFSLLVWKGTAAGTTNPALAPAMLYSPGPTWCWGGGTKSGRSDLRGRGGGG